jgi:hypothetical protein
MFFRVSEDERERFRAWSERLEMSQSNLFHALIQLDKVDEASSPVRCVVLDTKTTRSLAGELKRWGYHFNQANHALNSIVYLLRLEEEGEDWAMNQIDNVRFKIENLQKGVDDIRYGLVDITDKPTLFL